MDTSLRERLLDNQSITVFGSKLLMGGYTAEDIVGVNYGVVFPQ